MMSGRKFRLRRKRTEDETAVSSSRASNPGTETLSHNPGLESLELMQVEPARLQLDPAATNRGHRLDRARALCEQSLDGWCVTDPDTRVGLLQAQTCNVRSKCRCSCVLQFTLCHAFSCVLHRPPSQLIHCTALYLRLQSHDCFCVQDKKNRFTTASREGLNTEPGEAGEAL